LSSLVRKTFWPGAIAIGFLVFLGAIGYGPRSSAQVFTDDLQPGDLCAIYGPEIITETDNGASAIYVGVVHADDEDDTFGADIDDTSGNTDITSRFESDDDEVEEITPTNTIIGLFADEVDDYDDDEIDDLEAEFGVEFDDMTCDLDPIDEEDLADDLEADILQKINDGEAVLGCTTPNYFSDATNPFGITAAECPYDPLEDEAVGGTADIDCPDATPTDPPFCAVGGAIVDAVVDALVDFIVDEGGIDVPEDVDCEGLGLAAKNAALAAGAPDEIAEQIADAIWSQCNAGEFDDFFIAAPEIMIIDVTCTEAGDFQLTFFDATESDDSLTMEVTCVGPVDDMTLTADPTMVETVPVGASVEYSLILANLVDENEDPITGPAIVNFSTNRCEFLEEDGLTEEQFNAVAAAFDDWDINDPSTAVAINNAVATIAADADDVSNDVASFIADDDFDNLDVEEGDNIAAIILDCSDNTQAPGTATITAEIDQEGADIVKTVNVAVVGPPASVTAAASVASVTCGDTATIVVTVKDAAGQNVSEHTLVEAVTNFGGVLGGTGAVAAQRGLVTPVSSTVAETFNGVATFTLITSDTHVGNYNIVVATGGGGTITGSTSSAASILGGTFSTAVVTANVSVACAMPAAPVAPTVTAPRTGTGITPPNTGDAGLVSTSSGAGLSLFVIAGVAAFALAGVATLKFARR
jgi:hypothetical protein